MFGDINRVELLGRVTQDVELKRTSTGTGVLNFSVVTNRSYKDSSGNWTQEPNYTQIVTYGKQAESFAAKIQKGTLLFIEGRLRTSSWQAQDGTKKYKTEVVMVSARLLDKYLKSENQGEQQPQDNGSYSNDEIDPNDLPF